MEASDVNMEKYGCIYILKSPSSKYYVGQTTHIDPYYYITKSYKWEKGNERPKLNSAISKYGFDNFRSEVLVYCFSKEDLDICEKMFIESFNSVKNGYNCDYGGAHGKHSEETILKIKLSNIGKKRSVEAIEKNRISHLGIRMTEDNRLKLIDRMSRFKHTEESKNKIRNSLIGSVHTKESKDLMINAKLKYKYVIKDKFDNTYETSNLNSFCKDKKIHQGHLSVNFYHKGWSIVSRVPLDEKIIQNIISL